MYLFLPLGPTDSTCKVFTCPNNKQQQCSTAFHPTTIITLPQKICATCFSLSCLPSLVMLLSETHVVLLIKDKQCTDIHPNRPRRHQSICALLTKPTATFGAGRHSPNVQLHVTPAVVFIVVALVIHPLHSICSSLNWLPFCPPACPPAAVIRIVVSSRRAGRRGGGVCPRGKLSRLSSETKCCGGFATPPGPFSAHSNGHGDQTHGRPEFRQTMNRLQITKCATL